MDLRLIQLYLPDSELQGASYLEEHKVPQKWHENMGEKNIQIQILIQAGKAEAVLDTLEKKYRKTEGFHILLLPVEAAIPRLEPPIVESPTGHGAEKNSKEKSKPIRISRAESTPTSPTPRK